MYIVILKLIFLSLTLDTFSMPKVAINLPEIYFDFKDTQTHRNNKNQKKKIKYRNHWKTTHPSYINPPPPLHTHSHTIRNKNKTLLHQNQEKTLNLCTYYKFSKYEANLPLFTPPKITICLDYHKNKITIKTLIFLSFENLKPCLEMLRGFYLT